MKHLCQSLQELALGNTTSLQNDAGMLKETHCPVQYCMMQDNILSYHALLPQGIYQNLSYFSPAVILDK